MGLVALDMTTGKSVTETRTMTYDTNARTTDETCLISNSTSTTTIYPCHEFNTSSGYTGTLLNASTSGKDCYYIVKCSPTVASSNIKVGCVSTERKEYWDDVNVGAGLHSGECVSRQINSNRTFANLVALFSCVGKCQEITLPWYGSYKMECWGANGANHTRETTTHYGGISGYVAGIIAMEKNKTLYVYVGDQSGFNGGGIVGPSAQLSWGSNGGGGTDIRLAKHNDTQYSTIWGGVASLRSRIIVAAGGGGANNRWDGYGEGDGGYGGGLTGGTGQSINATNGNNFTQYGGNQDSGGQVIGNGSAYTGKNYSGHWGRFGCAAQYGVHDINDDSAFNVQAGGGAGWYGGGGLAHSGGGGGSSFISGMTGCNGIDTSTGNHRGAGQPSIIAGKTYSFDNSSAVMYAGNSASRPTNPGGVLGYAKITSQ